MAKTWPSGASAASDIDFRADIVKATLIPTKIFMLEAHPGPSRTMYVARNGRKCPKIGHLDQLQPQISILEQILLKQHRFPI